MESPLSLCARIGTMNPPLTPPRRGTETARTDACSPPGRGRGWVGSWREREREQGAKGIEEDLSEITGSSVERILSDPQEGHVPARIRRSGDRPQIVTHCVFARPLEHDPHGSHQIVHRKWFPEFQTAHTPNKCVPFRIGLVAGHEYESLATARFDALNSNIEFVSWERGHNHVAQDQVEIRGDDLLQAFDSIFHADHCAMV